MIGRSISFSARTSLLLALNRCRVIRANIIHRTFCSLNSFDWNSLARAPFDICFTGRKGDEWQSIMRRVCTHIDATMSALPQPVRIDRSKSHGIKDRMFQYSRYMSPKSVHYVNLCDPNGILKNRPRIWDPDPSRLVSDRPDKLSKCRGRYTNISNFVEY
jgi:hypothetical protein